MFNDMPFNKPYTGIIVCLIILTVFGMTMFVFSMVTTQPEIPKQASATFVQCWSGGLEIYSATVKTRVYESGTRVQFKTDYGSVTITGDCVLTELIEEGE